MKSIKITPEGFVWYVIDDQSSVNLFLSNRMTLYELRNDGSEILIDNDKQMMNAIVNNIQIGIEIGHLDNLNKLWQIKQQKISKR